MDLSPAEIAHEKANINDQKSTTTIGVEVAFGFVALFFVIARLIFRIKSTKHGLGLDDYLLVVGMIATAVLVMSSSVEAWYLVGRQEITIVPEDVVINGKWQLVTGYSYVFALVFVKWSILALLVRIFTLDKRWFRISVYATATYIFLWFVGMVLTISLICRPITRWWSVEDNCSPSFETGWVSGIFNIISDVALIVLPQPLLWNLQMSFRKRLAVSAVFLTGSIATVISIVRIPFLEGTFLGDPEDATYNGYYAVIFTCLEPTIGIICACMPTMPQIFRSVAINLSNVFSDRRQLVSKDTLGAVNRSGTSHRTRSNDGANSSQRSGSGSGRGIRVGKTIDVYADDASGSRDDPHQYELRDLQAPR